MFLARAAGHDNPPDMVHPRKPNESMKTCPYSRLRLEATSSIRWPQWQWIVTKTASEFDGTRAGIAQSQ
jgi:hypothetical protein